MGTPEHDQNTHRHVGQSRGAGNPIMEALTMSSSRKRTDIMQALGTEAYLRTDAARRVSRAWLSRRTGLSLDELAERLDGPVASLDRLLDRAAARTAQPHEAGEQRRWRWGAA